MNGSKGSMKRLLTGLLVAALVTASFPSTVFAAGSITDPVATVPEGSVTDPAADPGSGGVENPAPEEDPEITLPTEGEEPAETQDPTDGEEPASPEEPVESSDALTDPIDETEDGLTSAADGEETEEEADALIPVLSEEEPERVGGKYGSGDGVITSDAGNWGYQFKFAKVGYQKDDIEPQTATLTNNGTKTLTLQDPVTLTDSAKGYWEFGPFIVNNSASNIVPAGGTATFTIRPKEGIKSEMIFNADGTIDPIFEEQVNPWFSVAGTEAGSTTVHKCFFRTNLGVGLAGEYTADEVNRLYGNKGCVVVSSTTITIPKNKTLRVKGMAVDNLGGSTSAISPYTADKDIKLTIQGEGTLVSENNIDLGTNRIGSEIIINPAGSAKENDGPGNTVKVTTAGLAARVKVAIGGGEVTSIGSELRDAIRTDHYAGVIEISGGTVVAAIDCDYRPAIEASSLTVQNADLTVNASKERAIFLYASTSGTISHFQIDHARVTAISDARTVVSCSRLKLGEEAYLYAESKDTENNDTYAIQTSCDPEAPYDPYITLDDSLKIYTPESGSVVNREGRGTIVDADGKPATKVLIQADPFKIIDKDGEPVDEQTLNWEFANVGYKVTDDEGPEAKTVTLKNNHPAALTLEEPSVTNADLSDKWTVGPLMVDGKKTSTIPKGRTATFTIRPKPGIVATWNEAEEKWDNTIFDFTVRTADGTSEKKLTTRIMVGLIGNSSYGSVNGGHISGSTLAAAYADDEIAFLGGVGDVTIDLAAKDHVRIGGLRMTDESIYLNLKITGGGALETGCIRAVGIYIGSNDKEAANPVIYADTLEGVTAGDIHSDIAIEGGEVHVAKKIVTNNLYLGGEKATATASAKLISDGSIKADNKVFIANGCELTAALSDKTAAAAVECTTFTMYNAKVNITGPATSDRQYNCLQAEYVNIYDGSFTAVNSGTADGSYAVLARQIVISKGKDENSERVPEPHITVGSKHNSAIVSEDSSNGCLEVNGRAVILAQAQMDDYVINGNEKGAIRINRDNIRCLKINDPVNQIVLPKNGTVGVKTSTCYIMNDNKTRAANTVLIQPVEEGSGEEEIKKEISISPKSLQLTAVEGEAARPQTILIENTGTVPVNMKEISWDRGAEDRVYFDVTRSADILLPGCSMTLTVSKKAEQENDRPIPGREEPYTNTLKIRPYTLDYGYVEDENGRINREIPVSLTVTPAFTLSPSGTTAKPVSLGEIMEGERFDPQWFTLTNNGTRRRHFDIALKNWDDDDENYAYLALELSHNGISLEPGQSLSFRVSPSDFFSDFVTTGEYKTRVVVKDSNSVVKTSYLSGTVSPVPTGLWMKQIADQRYDGTAKKPAPEVWYGTTKLSEQNYTVTYTNNINAAEADAKKTVNGKEVSIAPTVTVKGKGNFTGTRSGTFAIKPAPVAQAYTDADLAVNEGKLNAHVTLPYNGKEQQAKFVLKYEYDDGRVVTLKEKTDYTLTYKCTPKAVGVYDVVVTGQGNYSETRTLKLAIIDPDKETLISKATIPAVPNQTVDGDGRKIVLKTKAAAACGNDEVFALDASKKNDFLFTVKKGTEILKEGKDYALSYSENQYPGTATVTISGKGRWAGSVTKTFQIAAVPLSSVKQEGFTAEFFYTGAEFRQPMKLVDNTLKKELVPNKDYFMTYPSGTPKDPGTYEVVYTGIGRYTGTVKKAYRIASDIKVCTVEGLDPTCLWTGTAIVPEGMKLTGGGKELATGTDYDCSITNNVNPSTATVTFTGKGKYTGTLKKTFRIVNCPIDAGGRLEIKQPGDPADWDSLNDWGAPDKEQSASWATATYRKSGAKPEPVIVDKGRNNYILAAGTDYTLQWSNNTAVYTAADLTTNKKVPTLTITGKGRYAGKMTRSFFMGQASFADVTVTASDVAYKNEKGAYRKTTVKLTDADGKLLTAGTDYYPLTDGNTKFYVMNGSTIGEELAADAIPVAGTRIGVILVAKSSNYSGSTTVTDGVNGCYYVTDKSISTAKITVKDQFYTGGEITLTKPEQFVIGANETHQLGQDFEVVPKSYQNNRKIGTARVTIRGKGSAGMTGTKTLTFRIVARPLDGIALLSEDLESGVYWEANNKDDRLEFAFSKSGVRPKVEIRDSNLNILLVEGEDYTLSWKNNTVRWSDGSDPNKLPTLTATGKGNYTKSVSWYFEIGKRTLKKNDFTLSVANKLQPLTHTDANNAEVLDGLIFKEAAMTATLTENASGKKLGGNEFTVSYAYDAAGTVKRYDEDMGYINHDVTAGSQVFDGDVLKPGTMLRATVAAIGSGNYQKSYTDTFRVFATENLGAATITAPADLEYCATTTGQITAGTDRFVVKARVGTSMVVLDPSCYQLNNWQDNDKAGTAKVTVSGIEEKGVKGSKTVAVKIAPASLEAQAAQRMLLVLMTDDFTGQKDYANDGVSDYYYVRSGVKPIPDSVILKSSPYPNSAQVPLVRDQDYTVSWKANTKAFTQTNRSRITAQTPVMVLTGKGNLTGKLEIPFNIPQRPINDNNMFSLSAADVVYQYKPGNFLLRDVTLTDADGKKLVSGTDYYASADKDHPFMYYNGGTSAITVKKADAENPEPVGPNGELSKDDIVLYDPGDEVIIRVVVTGKNNYVANRSGTYRMIAAANLNTATATIPEQVYTGKPVTLGHDTDGDDEIDDIVVTVRINGNEVPLKFDTDYTITGYENNTKAGTAKVTITGVPAKGFAGSKTFTFRITAYDLGK